MELTVILCFCAVVVLPFLVKRHGGRCGAGCKMASRSAVLLAFVTVATVGRSQYDTCITFAEETFNQFPAGWTVTHGGGYDARYSRDAYVSTISHNTPMGLYLTGNQDFYISMPYMATDFGDGANLLFWTHGECNLEVGSAADPADISSFPPAGLLFHACGVATPCGGPLVGAAGRPLYRFPQGDEWVLHARRYPRYNKWMPDVGLPCGKRCQLCHREKRW